MPIFTYSEYSSTIPEFTNQFVNRLIAYLIDDDLINYQDEVLFDENDIIFFKALKAYVDSSELNANVAKSLGYSCSHDFNYYSYDTSRRTKVFSEYYQIFTPFQSKDEYMTLMPEDIIDHIFRRIQNSNRVNCCKTVVCINNNIEKFLKGLKGMSSLKKEEISSQLKKKFNQDLSLNVINYYDAAGKIYIFLQNLKNNNLIDELSDQDKLNLALLLAVFHYNGVTTNSTFNEQQEIISFLEANGITKDLIEKKMNIFINMEALNSRDPSVVLSKYFTNVKVYNIYRKDLTVGLLFNKLINEGFEDSIFVKQLLGSLNVPLANVSKVNEEIKKIESQANDTTLDDFYRDFMPPVVSFLKRVTRIYTYLLSKKDQFDKAYLETNYDFRTLAIFLAAFEFDNKFAQYFIENGITLDKVLNLLGLPNKEQYIKKLTAIPSNNKLAVEFKNLTISGHNYNYSKPNISVNGIVNNLDDKERTKSMVIHKIYDSLTNKKLNDNYEKQMVEYHNRKDKERKDALTEELLGNISIDVYNFLRILNNYYIEFKNVSLNPIDREQLAIIYAASRYDKRIDNYLTSFGMKREKISAKLKINFNYDAYTFNIDYINDVFSKYIFDRPKEQITVYSIFENAFNPELVNTINLRSLLYEFGKEPEDFLDIENKLQAFDKEQAKKAQEQVQDEIFKKCDSEAKKIMEDTLLLHELIATNMDSYPLVSTIEDVEELSLLIAILLNDESYVPFFTRNGVTLNEILTKVGLDYNTLTSIRKMNVNKELLLNYNNYLSGKRITTKDLIKALFDDKINPSKVIESITALTGNNYDYLVEEVENKKERELTPEQGMQVLTAEEVEVIKPTSLSSIADYGLSISKHSKYINDALHTIMFADTLEHSLDEINKLLGEVSYEETVPLPYKRSFLERLFDPDEPVKIVKKYNPSKIGEIEEQIDIQIATLTKELQGYEFIKKYIEIYLSKLTEYLEHLKQCQAYLEPVNLDEPTDEISRFTQMLNQTSSEKIIQDKITTFETMILLMKQELMAVHSSIINHFVTINSLQTSKMAILPLIATEMAINIGKTTEGESLKLTGELVSLLENVVNKNVEATIENLHRLRLSSVSEETYKALSSEITRYISTVDRTKGLLNPLEEEKEDEQKHQL